MLSVKKCMRVLKNIHPSKLIHQIFKQYSTEVLLPSHTSSKCTVLLQAKCLNAKTSHLRAASFPKYYSVKAAQNNEDENYRSENNITVIGEDIPSPYTDVEQCDFPDYIKDFLKTHGFTKPTVIQSQGWPIALEGKNLVGVAQTGTGKTLGYLLPALVHIQKSKDKYGTPIVLVLAPTRELAKQIEAVAKDFEMLLNIRCACLYGGTSKQQQYLKLRSGVDIVIATPGRLNDFLSARVTSLQRCTYVVLDEADRMLDMGFEPQIRQVLEEVPAERQILMFSATWPVEVQHLAKDYLGEFVQVNVGSTELSANKNIKQHVHICEQENKLLLFKDIVKQISQSPDYGKILVFANTKRVVDYLCQNLNRQKLRAVGIHGDKAQDQRDHILNEFKSGSANILVATDVAARGLDVDGVSHVINFDFPFEFESYIHRIGRTGRYDKKGESHTLLTPSDSHVRKLIDVLKEANQEVSQELIEMASMGSRSNKSYNPNANLWMRNEHSGGQYSNSREERYERYGQDRNDRYGQDRNDRYKQDRNARYGQDRNARYGQDRNDRYGQDRNDRYGQDRNDSYGQDRNDRNERDGGKQSFRHWSRDL